ncbi:MAG: FAD-dependent oxidoreductase [Gaiellales bacterium]
MCRRTRQARATPRPPGRCRARGRRDHALDSPAPGLGEWARVVNYRKIQIAKLPNVEFIPRTRLDAADVRNYGADIVVVATGARWADDGLNPFSHGPIPGADASQPWQLTPEQIMVDGKPVPGDRVVVLDNDGYFMGVSLAERLALEGKTVTVVSHLGHVAQYMHYTMERPDMIRRLRRLGVHELGEHGVVSIEPGQVTCVDLYKEDKVTQLEADAVVLVTARRSDEALFRELEETDGLAVYRIGDCEAPRLIADCVFSGHRLAREIDSDDPATPKAFIRERRVLVPDPAARMGPRG